MAAVQQVLLAASGAATFSGALDSYASGLWFCGGIKRLLGSYTGSLLRVRKTTGADTTTEQDIGYLSDGTLDTGALATFIGSQTAVVTKVYDQSGNGNNFQQTTAGLQPRIASAGTYDGFIRWDGTDDRLDSANTTPVVAAFSVGGRYADRSLAVNPNNIAIFTQNNILVAGHNAWLVQQQGGDGKIDAYIGNGTASFINNYNNATTSEVADLFVFGRATNRAIMYRGGASVTIFSTPSAAATPGNYTAETVFIGGYTGGVASNPMNGKWFAIWSTDQAANGAAITSAL